MAAGSDSARKAFWKRGSNNAKLPGRPQQVYGNNNKDHVPTDPTVVAGTPTKGPKTFEEFEKETDDAWDDKEEDFSEQLSSSPFDTERPLSDHPAERTPRTSLKATVAEEIITTPVVLETQRSRTLSNPNIERKIVKEQLLCPVDFLDVPDRETTRLQKFGKLLAGPNTDLDELRKLSWSGVPPSVRATTWQLLCGYLPPNIDWREETLQRKRQEYRNFIERYYPMRNDLLHKDTFQQIQKDVPRMHRDVALFQQQQVQECFERILFIWSMRHPASGYVQGINDLVTPFFVVFLSYHISGGTNPETFDILRLSEDTLRSIEADSFWCMQRLLEGIQDNYTLAQPGIQSKIHQLRELMKRLDASLDAHLTQNAVEYIHFAFRWMNNLLMREFTLKCIIRLWDSYLSERDGFAKFHVFVCAALLQRFSDLIKAGKDFQEIMLHLQNLPTSNWTDSEVELLLAEAYKLSFMFADAPGHLSIAKS